MAKPPPTGASLRSPPDRMKKLLGRIASEPALPFAPLYFGPLLIALCMILRSTDVFFRSGALQFAEPLVLVTWEHLIVSLALIFYLPRLRRLARAPAKVIIAVLVIGSFVSLGGILCFSAAFRLMNPAVVILLQKLQPVVTLLLATMFLGERPGRSFYVLSTVAILAGYVLSFGLTSPFALLTGTGTSIQGVGFAVLSVVLWGSGTVLGRYVLLNSAGIFENLDLTLFRYFIGATTGSLLIAVLGKGAAATSFVRLPLTVGLQIIYMAVIAGFAALWVFYQGLERTRASLASILELIFPLSSAVIVWLFLDKPLSPEQIVSAFVLLLSVTCMTLLARSKR